MSLVQAVYSAFLDPASEAMLHLSQVRLGGDPAGLYCSRIIREAGKITDYEAYHKELTDFLGRYNELGVSALAQYVQHRRIILDFLERAIKLPEEKKNYSLEKVVHQLVFPMQHMRLDRMTIDRSDRHMQAFR